VPSFAEKLRVYMGVIMGVVGVASALVGSVFWMQATFAEAADMRQVKASIIQMEINSYNKEKREIKRALRRAEDREEQNSLRDDLDDITDEIVIHEKRKEEILNE